MVLQLLGVIVSALALNAGSVCVDSEPLGVPDVAAGGCAIVLPFDARVASFALLSLQVTLLNWIVRVPVAFGSVGASASCFATQLDPDCTCVQLAFVLPVAIGAVTYAVPGVVVVSRAVALTWVAKV